MKDESTGKIDTALIMFATCSFRIAVPKGTHTPDQQRLQQLWNGTHLKNGQHVAVEEWRDVPKVLIDESPPPSNLIAELSQRFFEDENLINREIMNDLKKMNALPCSKCNYVHTHCRCGPKAE